MKSTIIRLSAVLLFGPSIFTLQAEAGWFDKAKSILGGASQEAGSTYTADSLYSGEMASALKEALTVSTKRAVSSLTDTESDGLGLTLPKSIEKLRKPLSAVKQEALLDDLTATLNTAAKHGLASSPEILSNAIKDLKVEDVKQLFSGKDDAITRYLESKCRTAIADDMLPVFAQSTDKYGAVAAYNKVVDALPASTGGFLSKLKGLTGYDVSSFDLNSYVTEKTLDKLFVTIAAEEKAIRDNPLQRSTELLKKYFGQ